MNIHPENVVDCHIHDWKGSMIRRQQWRQIFITIWDERGLWWAILNKIQWWMMLTRKRVVVSNHWQDWRTLGWKTLQHAPYFVVSLPLLLNKEIGNDYSTMNSAHKCSTLVLWYTETNVHSKTTLQHKAGKWHCLDECLHSQQRVHM